MSKFDIIRLIGVAAYVSGYGLLQFNILQSTDNKYFILNGAGSILIIISLFKNFNLPSLASQSLWLLFTIIGFFRSRARTHRLPIAPR